MPGRIIVTADAKVGAADNFQIIRETRMAKGKVIRGEIHLFTGNEAVQVWLVWVSSDLLIPVVLHDDDEDAVQMRNALSLLSFHLRS